MLQNFFFPWKRGEKIIKNVPNVGSFGMTSDFGAETCTGGSAGAKIGTAWFCWCVVGTCSFGPGGIVCFSLDAAAWATFLVNDEIATLLSFCEMTI